MISTHGMVTALATAAFPTVAVLVGIFVNTRRLNDFARIFDAGFADTRRGFDETRRHIDDLKESLLSDIFRMEQVIDARLKHLEEHLQR